MIGELSLPAIHTKVVILMDNHEEREKNKITITFLIWYAPSIHIVKVIDLCETFRLIPCSTCFAQRSAVSQCLDVHSVLAEQEVEYVFTKEEFAAFGKQ